MGVVVRVCGPLEMLRDGHDVTPAAGKQRVVLAALAIAAGRSVSMAQLVDDVWGESPVDSARKTLQVYIGRLRDALGDDVIVTADAGYRLDTDVVRLDHAEFDAAVRRADAAEQDGDVEAATRTLRAALSLWRGEPLTNVPSESLRRRAVPALLEHRLHITEQCCDLEVARGRAGDAVVELRALVDENPLRERTWVSLMHALYASGRQADALAAYQEVSETLAERLGVDPGAELQRTHQEILTQALNVPRRAATPAPEVPRQLPAPPHTFTGREDELADVDRCHDSATVAITVIDGMAGVGKTALALRAAHRMVGRYPDGQLFIDLHGYTRDTAPVEPVDALDRMLRALGVRGDRVPERVDERAALYRSQLAGRRMLIVLDNATSEDQVVPLLPGTPGCRVLVTSRRRLAGLDHTHAVSLDVLPSSDAVTLLRRAAGEHRLSDEPPDLVAATAELCGRLPLAVRLAGARLRSRPTWTLAHLADRLREQQHRLAELEAGQRSVTSALDLSYRYLTADQQRLYRWLSLHPGHDIDTHAAAALAGVALVSARRILDQLLDHHLLQEPTPGRYLFHDLTRVHAAETAQAVDTESDRRAAVTRLLDHYRSRASTAMDTAYPYERDRRPRVPPAATPAPDLPDPAAAASWLDTELPNLLAVAQHAAGRGWPRHTMDLSGILHRHLRARGRYPAAETLHHEALAIARATGERASEHDALHALGQLHYLQGRYDQAHDHYQQALDIARTTGHRSGELYTLHALGNVHRSTGRHERAVDLYGQALQIARATGNRTGELTALNGLGNLHLLHGRYEQATDHYQQALQIVRTTDDCIGDLYAMPLHGLGNVHRLHGRYEQAADHYQQALQIAHAAGHLHGELTVLLSLATVHRVQGRYEEAANHYAQALHLARKIDIRNSQFEALQGMGRLHHVTGHPDDALTHHEQALALATDLRQPADQVRAHDGLAHAFAALDRPDGARRHWRKALDIQSTLGADQIEEPEVTAPAIRANLAELDRSPATHVHM